MRTSASRPSWSSLQAFNAAARRQSFRQAAVDLGVLPSAISHQIKAIEDWLGAPLFMRESRQVRLTSTGVALARVLSRSFRDIDAALDQSGTRGKRAELKIAALPMFAGAWLMPRLLSFEAGHPGLSLSIDTSTSLADVENGAADIAIRNVVAPTPGLHNRKLLDLRATPLCTSDVASDLETPDDLARATLIGLNSGRAGWPEWFAAVGCPAVKPRRTMQFDTFLGALEATAQGQGVMLGLVPLVWSSPMASKLVAPFRTAPAEVGAYFVACRKVDRAHPTVQAFISWLISEMRIDLPKLKRIDRERLMR